MKTAVFTMLLLVTFSLRAQAPAAVDMAKEPHHRVVVENSYVRALRFSLPSGESTLLHAHNVPYIAVSLGAADYANDVASKPEVRGKTVDGQVNYSRGGFAHFVKADAGIPFNNFTVELLRPQGEPRNLCQKIVDAPLDCPADSIKPPADSLAGALAGAVEQKRLFETDDVLVTSFSFAMKQSYNESGPQRARLLIVGEGSELQAEISGETTKSLHGGEVLWIDSGKNLTILTPGENKVTHFFVLSFKTADAAKP